MISYVCPTYPGVTRPGHPGHPPSPGVEVVAFHAHTALRLLEEEAPQRLENGHTHVPWRWLSPKGGVPGVILENYPNFLGGKKSVFTVYPHVFLNKMAFNGYVRTCHEDIMGYNFDMI